MNYKMRTNCPFCGENKVTVPESERTDGVVSTNYKAVCCNCGANGPTAEIVPEALNLWDSGIKGSRISSETKVLSEKSVEDSRVCMSIDMERFLRKCSSPNHEAPNLIKHSLRQSLPYGVWYTKDGNVILYNRGYSPIYSKYPGKEIIEECHRWVSDIVRSENFYNDSNPVISYSTNKPNKKTIAKLSLVLTAFANGEDLTKFFI